MSTLLPRNTINYFVVTVVVTSGEGAKTETPGTFTGSVQPTTGKDLEFLPVGREDIGTIKIYSDTQLNVAIAGTNKSGDIVVWEGQRWECIQEMKFQNGLIEHYKYIARYEGEV